MILSTHFIAGAAVASYTISPVFLVGGAILLHFILDLIPHWEYVNLPNELKNKIPYLLIDLVAGPLTIFLIILLFDGFDFQRILWFFLGGFAGMLPDSLTLLHINFPKNKFLKAFYEFHNSIQLLFVGEKRIPWKIGFTFQIMLDLVAIIFIVLSKA